MSSYNDTTRYPPNQDDLYRTDYGPIGFEKVAGTYPSGPSAVYPPRYTVPSGYTGQPTV